jgi:hypothetical protein
MNRRLLYTLAFGIPVVILAAILGFYLYIFIQLECCAGL